MRKNWERTGLLKGVKEDFKDTLAGALESQRLFNEQCKLPAQFMRMSMPLVRRILPATKSKIIIDKKSSKTIKLVKFKEVKSFDEEAGYTAMLSAELVNIINKYDTFHFYAFGLVDGYVVVYGENNAKD